MIASIHCRISGHTQLTDLGEFTEDDHRHVYICGRCKQWVIGHAPPEDIDYVMPPDEQVVRA